jgi:anhydro-N-acetylmuramic acid kinase
MVYKVIGLMSGSSLDGLDIVYVHIDESRGKWSFEIKAAACHPYSAEWVTRLQQAQKIAVPDFLKLHTSFGQHLGQQVAEFMTANELDLKVDFLAVHGHTVFHDPAAATTFQLGDGAAISASLAMPVISDLRAMDIALGGQGAPIVPVGDRLFFGGHQYWLNLGGIANITIKHNDDYLAFDIGACNQVLNHFAAKKGLEYDDAGSLAKSGMVNEKVLEQLNELPYYRQDAPKSLANEFSVQEVIPVLEAAGLSVEDALATAVYHIAEQVVASIKNNPQPGGPVTMLATGGGALNSHLVAVLQSLLEPEEVSVVIPDEQLIRYKEAVVMALIGTLRWREEENVFSSVTGAARDSVGGALWMGR